MTPYERKTFGYSFGISAGLHIAILFLSLFFPAKVVYGLRYGEYVRVGVWEYEMPVAGERSAKPQEKAKPAKIKKEEKILTSKEGEKTAPAQETEEKEKPYNPADYPGDREAGLVSVSPLISPKTIQNLRLSGEVLLDVVVSQEGKPKSIRIRQSSGNPLLDDFALKMVSRLQFTPKIYKGEKVEGQVLVRCALSPKYSICAY